MDSLRDAVDVSLGSFQWFVLVYFLVLNTIYLVLTVIATIDLVGYFRRRTFSGDDVVFANPMTLPVSVIVPAHNEEAVIVDSARAMMALRYPDRRGRDRRRRFHGCDVLAAKAAFDLVEVPLGGPRSGPWRGDAFSPRMCLAMEPHSSSCARRQPARRQTPTMSASMRPVTHWCAWSTPTPCSTRTRLLRVTKPFVDDPIRTVATGGTIRGHQRLSCRPWTTRRSSHAAAHGSPASRSSSTCGPSCSAGRAGRDCRAC